MFGLILGDKRAFGSSVALIWIPRIYLVFQRQKKHHVHWFSRDVFSERSIQLPVHVALHIRFCPLDSVSVELIIVDIDEVS